jgi:predicted dehydrogenase
MSDVRVVVFGCGTPQLSMGWFHLTQLVEMPLARCVAVVEPFHLGDGNSNKAFERFRAELRTSHPDLEFYASLEALPPLHTDAGSNVLALIAARTADAPACFAAALAKGATHIYLEKPGATSAQQLAEMRAEAHSYNSLRIMRPHCYAMRCDAMRCDAMRCDAMRCDAMRCDGDGDAMAMAMLC